MVELTKKRNAVGTTTVIAIVVVVLIIAGVAGYALSSGRTTTVTQSASTITSTATSTSTSVSTSVATSVSTATSISTATSVSTSTATSTQTNTVTSTGTVTSTSISTATSIQTSTSTVVSTSTQTTYPTPVLPSTLPSLGSPISEAGSSLLYPLFQLWAANFTQKYSNVQVNTAAGGSGAGQTGVESGTINIGGSDPFLSNAQQSAYPSILDIAVAVSAQQVNYNLPGIPQSTHLDLNGNVLAGIYNGTITTWNNPAIVALNPGVTLPSATIVPLHRSDSSGDTNLFTTYLSDTSSDWAKNFGSGNTITWANVPAAAAENGNGGMLSACQATQYSIAYIGISYLASANSDGLGNAALQNLAGNYVQITTPNIQSAVNSQYQNTPPSERYSLEYGPGANSYPIVNYEFALVNENQPSVALATDIQALLDYATLPQYGNSAYFLNQVGFVALPASIAQLSWAQIAEISG